MNPTESNIPIRCEMDELRLENERLKALLAKNGLIDYDSSSSSVLNGLPVAVWEEDFSDVKKFLDDLSNKGITDFNWYFSENPEDVAHCASLIKVVSLNKAALKMTGLDAPPERIIDLPRFFTKESESVFKEEFVVLANGGTSFRSDAVTVDMEDHSMQIIFQVNVVEGHEHDLSRVLVTVTDITEESVLKKELDRSEMRWRKIFTSLVDDVMIIDKNLKIVQTNFDSLKTPTAKNPLGKSVLDLVVPEEKDEAESFYIKVFSTGRAAKTEHRSKNGEAETIHNIIESTHNRWESRANGSCSSEYDQPAKHGTRTRYFGG